MRKALLLSISFLFMVVGVFAQNDKAVETAPATSTTKAVMTFEDGKSDTSVDYGTIKQNSEPLRVVKFTNTGTEPLIIKNARGSCGCTVPTWPKEPILPGETSQIEIRYATNRIGKINKRVTITTNEDKKHIIKVLGNVLKGDAEKSAPKKAPSVIDNGGH